MNQVDLISSIDRELLSVGDFLSNIGSGRYDIGLDEKTSYELKSEVLRRFLGWSRRVILEGIHFDIGDFNERGYVGTSDYDVACSLLGMGIGMPYGEFSIRVDVDAGGKRIPMVFIVKVLDISGVEYFVVLPLYMTREGKEVCHSVFPPVVVLGTFQRDLDLGGSGDDMGEVFFGGSVIPGEVDGLLGDLVLQVISSSKGDRVSTYGFSYLFFDGSLNDEGVKDSGRDFMNYYMQEYFHKFLFLLNTRGVSEGVVKPKAGFNRSRVKRGKLPIRDHRVLKFSLPKGRKLVRSGRGDGVVMPYHSVMGHTKVYNKENPLFGRYVGPVWCPAHFRGDEGHGEITKDYKLVARRRSSK